MRRITGRPCLSFEEVRLGSNRKAAGLGMAAGLLAGAVTFGAVAAQAADKWDDRPFLGSATGTSTAGLTGTTGTGTINATHIGDATYTIAANQDYPRHVEQSDHPTGQCAFVEDGVNGDNTPGFVITAANGDQIFGYIDDDRSVTCAPDNQPPTGPAVGNVYTSTLYIEVIGGTGRFADATGWLFSEGESTITGLQGPPTPGASADDVSSILGDIDY